MRTKTSTKRRVAVALAGALFSTGLSVVVAAPAEAHNPWNYCTHRTDGTAGMQSDKHGSTGYKFYWQNGRHWNQAGIHWHANEYRQWYRKTWYSANLPCYN